MNKLLIIFLSGTLCFSGYASSEESNISIEKKKYEVTIIDGAESKYLTDTLKPEMIVEENIILKNTIKKTLKDIVYDFKLTSKSSLISVKNENNKITMTYSNDEGVSFKEYPIYFNSEPINDNQYTDVRFFIKYLEPKESVTLKIRYNYNYFSESPRKGTVEDIAE